jgi:hypothetical protein
MALVVGSGAVVAVTSSPPMEFRDFSPLPTGLMLSIAIGVAAGYATTDDVGWRQLMGLAAASQITLVPAWLGVALVIGFSEIGSTAPVERLLSWGLNLAAIVGTIVAVYVLQGLKATDVKRWLERPRPLERKRAA